MDSTLTVFTAVKNGFNPNFILQIRMDSTLTVFTAVKNGFNPNCIYYSKEWILP